MAASRYKPGDGTLDIEDSSSQPDHFIQRVVQQKHSMQDWAKPKPVIVPLQDSVLFLTRETQYRVDAGRRCVTLQHGLAS